MDKRKEPPTEISGTLIKRQRAEAPPSTEIAISSGRDERSQGLIRTVQRTSGLEAPIVSLHGAHTVSIQSELANFDGKNRPNALF